MDNNLWYYSDGKKQSGPITEMELHTLIEEGIISMDSYLWTKGFKKWTLVNEIDEFKDIESNVPPKPPFVSKNDESQPINIKENIKEKIYSIRHEVHEGELYKLSIPLIIGLVITLIIVIAQITPSENPEKVAQKFIQYVNDGEMIKAIEYISFNNNGLMSINELINVNESLNVDLADELTDDITILTSKVDKQGDYARVHLSCNQVGHNGVVYYTFVMQKVDNEWKIYDIIDQYN